MARWMGMRRVLWLVGDRSIFVLHSSLGCFLVYIYPFNGDIPIPGNVWMLLDV